MQSWCHIRLQRVGVPRIILLQKWDNTSAEISLDRSLTRCWHYWRSQAQLGAVQMYPSTGSNSPLTKYTNRALSTSKIEPYPSLESRLELWGYTTQTRPAPALPMPNEIVSAPMQASTYLCVSIVLVMDVHLVSLESSARHYAMKGVTSPVRQSVNRHRQMANVFVTACQHLLRLLLFINATLFWNAVHK